MEMPTYEEFISNPQVLVAIEKAARGARAEAVHQFIVAPLKQLFKRVARTPAHGLKTRAA